MHTIGSLLQNQNPDREYFLRHILKINQTELLSQLNKPITEAQLKQLTTLERKRAAGWPVQYIVDEAWFYGLKLKVAPGVLIPRPESELMVDRVLALATEHKNCSVIDFGTGSGAIAIAVAKNSSVPVWAVDISLKALSIARANARTHKVAIKFHKDDIRRKIAWPKTDHVIVAANLPYLSDARMKKLSAEVRREPKLALYGGRNGLDLYKKMFTALKTYAKNQQSVSMLLEIDPEQKTKLASLVGREFVKASIEFHRDLHGDIRMAEINL